MACCMLKVMYELRGVGGLKVSIYGVLVFERISRERLENLGDKKISRKVYIRISGCST